jgi:alanine dehydrogenase
MFAAASTARDISIAMHRLINNAIKQQFVRESSWHLSHHSPHYTRRESTFHAVASRHGATSRTSSLEHYFRDVIFRLTASLTTTNISTPN